MGKRRGNPKFLLTPKTLKETGLSAQMVGDAINYVYDILDSIDGKLAEGGGERLAELVELANLSAIIGNLFRTGIVRASDGKFRANDPHKYPDLVGAKPGVPDVEIKVALKTNQPKGHLIKPGPHIIVRYVLTTENGTLPPKKDVRGVVPWIWEVRVGELLDTHFNCSNTPGDSGKTAVINAAGMHALEVVYCDLDICPHSKSARAYRLLEDLFIHLKQQAD